MNEIENKCEKLTVAERAKRQALQEIEEEKYRKLVAEKKAELLAKRNKHWFPWRIRIINLNKGESKWQTCQTSFLKLSPVLLRQVGLKTPHKSPLTVKRR